MSPYFVTALLAYLLGSLPFGYLLVLAFRGQDVRDTGSGNIGATNVSRTSPALGIVTLLLDAAKGFAAVALVHFVLYPGSHLLATLAALCAIVGHMFPVWLRFRGGKGVATSLGSFLLLAPQSHPGGHRILPRDPAAIPLCLAGIDHRRRLVSCFRYLAERLWRPARRAWMMLAAVLLIILKHRDNVRRLAAGTEHRFRLGSQ